MDARHRLRQWMHQRQLTQRQLATLVGVSFPQINHLLHGRRNPSLASAVSIMRQTGIPAHLWAPVDTTRP